jgi:hypothetical protein
VAFVQRTRAEEKEAQPQATGQGESRPPGQPQKDVTMSDKQRIEAKVRAAANELAAEFGFAEAIRIVREIAQELDNQQWSKR